jgi:hypothetical protein
MQFNAEEYRFLSRRGSVPLAERPRLPSPGAEYETPPATPVIRRLPRHRVLAQALVGAAALTRAAAAAGLQDRYRNL